MSKISQILTDYDFWQNQTPMILREVTRQQLNNNYIDSYSIQSRTLKNAVQYTFGNGSYNSYKTLRAMCELCINKKIRFVFDYNLITSEMAQTLSPRDLLTQYRTEPLEDLHIYISHISKGKSYVKKLVDDNPGLNRLQPIESYIADDNTQFIRAFRSFPGTKQGDIVIFADTWTTSMLEKICILLPHLINLYQEDVEPDEKQSALLNVFACLHNVANMLTPSDSLTDTERTNIKQEINELLTDFVNVFDFTTASMNTFMDRLANVRNNVAKQHYVARLDDTKRTIERLENELEQAYNIKRDTEEQLLLFKHLKAIELQPFMDIINTSPHIETLMATDSSMILRITAPLQYYRSSDFEAYERNSSSSYNSMFNNIEKRVFHKIFVTREYSLILQGIITLSINEGYNNRNTLNLNARAHDLSDFTQFPNPHLYHYNCWSRAQTEMHKNIAEGNFDLVALQMIATVQSVNVAESPSFISGLLNDIKGSRDIRNLITLIDQDGNTKTWEEALEHERTLEQNAQFEQFKEDIRETVQAIQQSPTAQVLQDLADAVAANPRQYHQVEIPDDDANWETAPNNEGEDENENDQPEF